MRNKDDDIERLDEENVVWSSEEAVRQGNDRRRQTDRRAFNSRAITVPDMRQGLDRRLGGDRRKVRLTITGRAIDV